MAFACNPVFQDQYMDFAYDQYIWRIIIIDIRRGNTEVQMTIYRKARVNTYIFSIDIML